MSTAWSSRENQGNLPKISGYANRLVTNSLGYLLKSRVPSYEGLTKREYDENSTTYVTKIYVGQQSIFDDDEKGVSVTCPDGSSVSICEMSDKVQGIDVRVTDIEEELEAILGPTGGLQDVYSRTVVVSDYTAQTTDFIIACKNVVPITLTLPEIKHLTTNDRKKQYIVCDEGGNATASNVTIQPSNTDTISGAPKFVMSQGRSSISIYSNGSSGASGGWFIF
jgi:hypothetical protein